MLKLNWFSHQDLFIHPWHRGSLLRNFNGIVKKKLPQNRQNMGKIYGNFFNVLTIKLCDLTIYLKNIVFQVETSGLGTLYDENFGSYGLLILMLLVFNNTNKCNFFKSNFLQFLLLKCSQSIFKSKLIYMCKKCLLMVSQMSISQSAF